MNVGAFVVLLAVGCASQHDTGRRFEVPVIASGKLDAAVIAEKTGNCIVSDMEYTYTKSVRTVRNINPTPSPALAVAA